MGRSAVIILKSEDGNRSIAVDKENADELWDFFERDDRHKKKFDHICQLILGGHKNTDLYDREEIDEKSHGVTAMKFFKGQENARVYCKEITSEFGVLVVVCAELHIRKKSQKLTHKERNLIHKVAEYEYTKIEEQ